MFYSSGEVHSGNFDPGDSLVLHLWWHPPYEPSTKDLRCFLWATEEGDLPKDLLEVEEDEEEPALRLVTGPTSAQERPLNLLGSQRANEVEQEEPMATTTIYTISTTNEVRKKSAGNRIYLN